MKVQERSNRMAQLLAAFYRLDPDAAIELGKLIVEEKNHMYELGIHDAYAEIDVMEAERED